MQNKHRVPVSWSIPLAVVLGGWLVLFLSFLDVDSAILLSPLTTLGQGLRHLSLSGSGGNLAAWAILLVITFLPALGLLWRGRRWTDLLLALASIELFAGLYYQVNPFLFDAPLPLEPAWAMTWAAALLSTLAAWAVIRLLQYIAQEEQKGRTLANIMIASAIILVFFSTALLTVNHMAEVEAVVASNENSGLESTYTHTIMRVLFMLNVVVSALFGFLLLEGSQLVRALDEDAFSGQTIAIADRVSFRCRRLTVISLLIWAAGNLLQMLAFSRCRSISVEVHLPIGLILLSLCLTLLCRYFRRAKAISDDNATII